MRLKSLLLFFLLLLHLAVSLQAQYFNQQSNFIKANSHWVINREVLNFNTSPAQSTWNNFIQMTEGMATASDPVTGELLFYSTGFSCYNRNHEVMPNGDTLLGNGSGLGSGSTSQGVTIVPMIDSPGKYYLFSLSGPTDESWGSAMPGVLYYSVVDMSLEGGKGNVVASRKNIQLVKDSLSEGMIAIPGNNCDIWLMVHDAFRPVFRAFHITAAGIDPNPVLSHAGADLNVYVVGGMTLSPNRERIAVTSYTPLCMVGGIDSVAGMLLCKFDPNTGQVSEAIPIEKNLQGWMAAFSPDNTKLYLCSYDLLTAVNAIQQYSIEKHDTASINASKSLVANVRNTFCYLRLYNDTIYFPDYDSTELVHYLSSINKPNLKGSLCAYQEATVPLINNNSPQGLPSDVVYPFSRDSFYRTVLDTLICKKSWGDGMVLQAPVLINYAYQWSNDASDTILKITDGGTYWVRYNNGCHFRVDSFIVQVPEFPTPVINVDIFKLSTTAEYDTYRWLLNGSIIPGATQGAYEVRENGDYQVIVSLGDCMDTSAVYTISNYENSINSPGAIAAQIQVYPNPAFNVVHIKGPVSVSASIYSVDGRLLKTAMPATDIVIKDMPDGLYFIHFRDSDHSLIKVQPLVKMASN